MSKVTIFTDGAAKGNPGAAGIGVVVSDADGKILAEISEYIGETTNNAAEYTALLRGLEEAIKLGATEVEISTDSELMARQITGVYKVKAEHLREYHSRVLSLLKSFRKASITHVMREGNKIADKLARAGSRRTPIILTEQDEKEETPAVDSQETKDDTQISLDF